MLSNGPTMVKKTMYLSVSLRPFARYHLK